MGEHIKQLLKEIYYDPESEGGFGGVKRLYATASRRNSSVKLKDVVEWLREQDTYQLFKERKKRFLRVPIVVDNIDEQWQADLLDMTWLASKNDNFKYILVVIDILSRFAWTKPLKDKNGVTVARAFREIFELGRVPKKLQTDQGKEFINSNMKALMREMNINFFTSTDDVIKCAIAERFNRTLRTRIYRYLSANNTHRYLDVLPMITTSYNKSYHRTLCTTPESVNKETEKSVLLNIRKSHKKSSFIGMKPFDVGDHVRITRAKTLFEKGATSNWSEEIFRITKFKKTEQGFIYRIEDLDGEPVTSIFYHWELQKTPKPDKFRVEKVLRTRRNPITKQREYFVKWLGYPQKFNSWVENVERI